MEYLSLIFLHVAFSRCAGALCPSRGTSEKARDVAFAPRLMLPIGSVSRRHTITHRLHALETRLDPRRFVRLGRGTLANLDLIARVSPMPGGTAVVSLTTGQQLQVSRIQFRQLRDTLLNL